MSYITVQQAASVLSVDTQTVRNMCDDGTLSAVQVGRGKVRRTLRISTESFYHYLIRQHLRTERLRAEDEVAPGCSPISANPCWRPRYESRSHRLLKAWKTTLVPQESPGGPCGQIEPRARVDRPALPLGRLADHLDLAWPKSPKNPLAERLPVRQRRTAEDRLFLFSTPRDVAFGRCPLSCVRDLPTR